MNLFEKFHLPTVFPTSDHDVVLPGNATKFSPSKFVGILTGRASTFVVRNEACRVLIGWKRAESGSRFVLKIQHRNIIDEMIVCIAPTNSHKNLRKFDNRLFRAMLQCLNRKRTNF